MESRGKITNDQYNSASAVITYDREQIIIATKTDFCRITFNDCDELPLTLQRDLTEEGVVQ